MIARIIDAIIAVFDAMRHRYIRTGELITLKRSGTIPKRRKVVVHGVGRYAVVRIENYGSVRRDLIRKDAAGKWFYKYD